MQVACSSLPFTHRPLDETLAHIAGLGFTGWELAIRGDGVHLGHLDPNELVADPVLSRRMLAVQRAFPGLRCIGAGFEISKSSPLARELVLFSSCCGLLRGLGALAVTIFIYEDGAAPLVERYQAMLTIAQDHGLQLRVETHLNTATANPARALEWCRALSLNLTLDASHYIVQGIQPAQFRALWPFVREVQIRACAPGRMELQAIDFKRDELIPPGFDGEVVIEYIDREVNWDATLVALRTTLLASQGVVHHG